MVGKGGGGEQVEQKEGVWWWVVVQGQWGNNKNWDRTRVRWGKAEGNWVRCGAVEGR